MTGATSPFSNFAIGVLAPNSVAANSARKISQSMLIGVPEPWHVFQLLEFLCIGHIPLSILQ
jgi:hypothetical protein